MENQEHTNLAAEVRDIWNQNAGFWDDYMGKDGNHFHRLLVAPTAQELLNIQPGETVLDIACGNGNFSRRLAGLGAQVVAIDLSEKFIERAKAHSSEAANQITYKAIDASNREQMLALGVGKFNAAVANMALMDMVEIEPLLESLSQMLVPGGRFVFSVTHPCFQAPDATRLVEEEDRNGEIITRYAVKISKYITPAEFKGLGVIGQPAPQYYFHRPLSVLLKSCFQAGFVVDALEEPTFSADVNSRRPLSWSNFTEIPPVLVVGLRLLKS